MKSMEDSMDLARKLDLMRLAYMNGFISLAETVRQAETPLSKTSFRQLITFATNHCGIPPKSIVEIAGSDKSAVSRWIRERAAPPNSITREVIIDRILVLLRKKKKELETNLTCTNAG